MSTLAEVLAQGIRIHDGNRDKGAAALGDDLAAVVAEWMGSGEAEEVVVAVLEIAMRPDELVYEFQERQARAALAALAAHAKGEVS